jgi:LPXTG-site transpeptidase (sortase) family protein
MFMRCWIWVWLVALLITGCDAYKEAYMDLLEARLPPATGGRTLHIPVLGVNADITLFPLGTNTWDISPWERKAGQLEGLGWITTPINTVIAAHSEYPSHAPGIFSELDTMKAGDVIFVRDGNLQVRYVVRDVSVVDYRDLSVVYPTADHRLTLITCSIPSYVAAQNLYYDRVVVIADRVEDN